MINTARWRNRRLGGWWCPLSLTTCTECGQPLLRNAATVPRQVHVRCEDARRARYQRDDKHRQHKREHLAEYNQTWRERHPEQSEALLARWKAIARQEQALTRARVELETPLDRGG